MANILKAQINIDNRLLEALRKALDLIESYQIDIINSEDLIGIDLISMGFCQGVVYKNGLKEIEVILNKEETKEEEGQGISL